MTDWQPSPRYPDPLVQAVDQSFARYKLNLAKVERLFTGCRWSEGPVWFGDLRCLLWSDIPNNRVLRWDEETATTTVFRKPSDFTNGNTRDRQGRLVSCEHGGRRVRRTEHDGTITTLAATFDGRRLNSPNDVVVKSDGSVWFTDPPFGILGYYEGYKAEPELPGNVYRVDGTTGEVTVVADDVNGPNGLAFSPDESKLYIVASRADPREILAYDVTGGGRTLTNRRTFIVAGPGTPDGFRVDVDGNLWCGWGMAKKASTACGSSTPTAPTSGASTCRSAARTSASAGPIATDCSWPRARPSTRSTSTPRACPAAERRARTRGRQCGG